MQQRTKLVLVAASVIASSEAANYIAHVSGPLKTSAKLLDSYVSYSIEFSSFPDYAGNLSAPNDFSNNLLNNLGKLQGKNPIVRVGGNTQDYALYDRNLNVATNGTYTPASADFPTILTIGDAYFEFYKTWTNMQFTHGFNLADNTSLGHETLVKTAALACKALSGGKLLFWELGNEPDLFKTSAQGARRASNWTETDYVNEWIQKSRYIGDVVKQQCPDERYGYLAPSFAGIGNSLNDIKTWDAGLDKDGDVLAISQHNYISGATSPGVTLAHTLLNHTMTLQSLSQYVPSKNTLTAEYKIPYIMGETNSLYNEGAPGLSNSFGAALWGVDYLLTGAALGIRRFHLHQGTNYRYQSWQPIGTEKATKGTKAPYYGNLAVATALGDLSSNDVSVQTLVAEEKAVAHAIYRFSAVDSVMLINMNQYNYTNIDGGINTQPRPASTFTVQYDGWMEGQKLTVRRLSANGSDAITGITFDGYSYNYELNDGKPVLLSNVTRGETVTVSNGAVQVVVPDSSAALLS